MNRNGLGDELAVFLCVAFPEVRAHDLKDAVLLFDGEYTVAHEGRDDVSARCVVTGRLH